MIRRGFSPAGRLLQRGLAWGREDAPRRFLACRSLPRRRAFQPPGIRQKGFTLLELMVVFAIAALVVGVTIPIGSRFYDTMQYRDAVRAVNTAATAARYKAVTSGQAVDLLVNPDENALVVHPVGAEFDLDSLETLGGDFHLEVVSAEEVSPGGGLAAIRFYPLGGSTGGSVSVIRDNGAGVRLRVDWLLGRVTQEALEP